MGHHMRPERMPERVMGSLADQVFVDLAQHGGKAVGVFHVPLRAIMARGPQPVGRLAGHRAMEQAGRAGDR